LIAGEVTLSDSKTSTAVTVRRTRRAALLAAYLLLARSGVAVAQTPPAEEKPSVFRSGAREVLLDLVVRDQRGRSIRDLRPEEIKVYEDGVEQTLTSFRLIDGTRTELGPGTASAAPAAARPSATTAGSNGVSTGAPDPLRLNQLVSIVFHGLTPDSRKFVYDAALDFLEKNLADRVYVGVFGIDTHLRTLAPFTNDHARLGDAVREAAAGSMTSFAAFSGTVADNPIAQVDFSVPAEAGAAAGPQGQAAPGPNTRTINGDIYSDIMARVQANTAVAMEFFDRVDRADKVILSLQALVDAQKGLVGRKTVLLFSSGFPLPADSQWRFDQLVSEANRANVTFYSIDAVGLRTAPPLLNQGALLNQRLPPGLISLGGGASNPREFRQYESQIESIKANAQGNLQELAVETGGRLIADTNNFSKPLDRIVEDVLTYYEAAYQPPAPHHDGSFREVRVEIARSKSDVQTRNGYFDMPEDADFHVGPHELPLLAALRSDPQPSGFPFRSRVLRFPGTSTGALVTELALGDLEMTKSADGAMHEGRIAVLAQLKDASGRLVKKTSQDLPLRIETARLDAFHRGIFTLTRHWELPPGRYTLETAVHDHTSGRIGASRSVVVIQRAGDGPALSSVALIRRIDPAPEATGAAGEGTTNQDAGVQAANGDAALLAENAAAGNEPLDPFVCSLGKVAPTLSDVVDPRTAGSVSHYFVIYPAPQSDAKPELFLQYLRDGEVVAQSKPDLPEPRADGSIAYIATAPANNFPAGQYLVNVVLKQGDAGVVERAFFQVSP
jgi:VWFA-related protein